ncbi:MAG: molecular chaperone TorD family protein [Ilumatobacteraceae bacterium]
MSTDLAESAERRAAFAALSAALLLSEPGPRTAPYVERVPELAALADPACSVEFERIFLREVAPYESVFRSDTAERGGAFASRVADHFDDIGFDEHRTAQWRVAGPDHLGLELRAHAFLVGLEAAAWRSDRPDEATRHVEAQRRLFAEHLAWWAGLAVDALGVAAAGTPYAQLVEAIDHYLGDEIDRLRPLPLLDTSQLPAAEPIGRLGPRRLARHLLSPARSGMWLGVAEIGDAARRQGFPWRPMDGRQNLVPLVGAAHDAGEIAELVSPWAALAADAVDRHQRRADAQPGAEVAWRHYAALAVQTSQYLRHLEGGGMHRDDDHEMVIRVSGAGAAEAVEELRRMGHAVEILDD